MSPVLTSLKRHKLTAAMLLLQVALTCAIVTNVASIVCRRVQAADVPSGVAEQFLSVLKVEQLDGGGTPASAREDMAAIGRLGGVQGVAQVNTVPLGRSEDTYGVCPSREAFARAKAIMSLEGSGCVAASAYEGSRGILGVMGVHLLSGRDFRDDEYVANAPDVAIVSKALAERLFGVVDAVGRVMYQGDHPVTVVGVVDQLLAPRFVDPQDAQLTMIYPKSPAGGSAMYLIRSTGVDRHVLLRRAAAALATIDRQRLAPADDMRTFEEVRSSYFHRDRVLAIQLSVAALALMAVTAFGLAGLSTFWVEQRKRSIGIRRSLGATKSSIRSYFQLENGFVTGGGILLGMGLSYALGFWVRQHYGEPLFAFGWLVASATAITLIGQAAALGPAVRASRVSPAVVLVAE